jgi:hypothetical protein
MVKCFFLTYFLIGGEPEANTPVLQVLLTSSFDKEGMAAVYQRW